ncbi:hypothetical protein MN116_005776 [Schistosoma mekongi]|uniref:Uncharacterized protein n=1 Tax=Schistosoma mekongi TaxID=38744 RepID=A0AAE2D3U8_SCHME|nr:hypothetical protein MN116_005776 [Schistosoma mekongi]
MDIFCLLTGTQQHNTNDSVLSNDELLTSIEWSSILQKSYLIDPSKRKEQRLLRYAELEKLRNTEDQLMKMKQQLETYKTRLKEASNEISHNGSVKSYESNILTRLILSRINLICWLAELLELCSEFNDSIVHNKEKWILNLHKIKLLKNVAHNFHDKNVQNLNYVKYSQTIQTDDN